MRVQYYTATSVDGFIADDHNSLDWLFQFSGPEADDTYSQFIAGVGAIVMGSTTYQWILDHEIREDPSRWPYAQPTWVFSSRNLAGLAGHDIRFARDDVTSLLPELRAAAGEKNLWLVGGGDLVGQFHDAGLLDDLFLGVAPVVLGAGAPLLPRRLATPPLELRACRTLGAFVFLHYAVPGR